MEARNIKSNLQWLEMAEMNKSLAETVEEELMYTDEIHRIKMKLNGVKLTDSSIDCIGCGS